LTLFLTTLRNPLLAVGFLVFVVPFTAGISEQARAVFHWEIFTLDLLSIDASIGLLTGLLTLSFLNSKNRSYRENISDKSTVLKLLLIGFHVLILITVAIAISRNLYQSASPYSAKGFFYNLANLRYTSFHDDYFPLRDLFIFTAVITLSIRLLSLVRTTSQLMRSVLIPLAVATAIILGYALWSKFTGLGYNRDGVEVGVNSFFPDLHAYGGYAVAAFMGGLYYLRSHNSLIKLAAAGFCFLAAAGVVVSASRFSIATLFITCLGYIFLLLLQRPQKHLIKLVFISLTVLATVIFVGYWGDRGLFHQLASLPKIQSFKELDSALSERPQIFRSALLMYSHYPILGLGKGIFYRQSSIGEFSHSSFFVTYNGENAHNYFLQILAETGIIGLSLFCALFIYQAFYLRNPNTQIVTVLILGIFAGNLYGHSLLIANILVLLFILLGVSNIDRGGQEYSTPKKIIPIKFSKPWRYCILAVATVLFIGAIFEVKSSYGKIPFEPRFVCYKPIQYSDRHTSGLFEKTYKVTGNNLKLEYVVYHADAQRRPLKIEFSLKQAGRIIASKERTINAPGPYAESVNISQLRPGAEILLQIKTSRCFTPINLGVNGDKRPLGIQLNKVSQDERVVQGG
jgi:O-antigen ligase